MLVFDFDSIELECGGAVVNPRENVGSFLPEGEVEGLGATSKLHFRL